MKLKVGNDSQVTVVNLIKDDKQLKDNSLLSKLLENEVFANKKSDLYVDYDPSGESTIYLGLGDLDKLTVDDVRKAYHKVGKTLMEYKATSVNVNTDVFKDNTEEYTKAVVEGLLQSEAVFDKYLTEKKVKKTVETVYVNENSNINLKPLLEEVVAVYKGVSITRNLVNERPMRMYPELLANSAKAILEQVGIKVTVLDKKGIEELEMDALLSVAIGSDKDPRFIIMEYKENPDNDFTTALVGKGVTYDSGGYSLKPSKAMDTMFCDMGGAGAVIGTMYAVAKNGLKQNVTGLVAATENLVDGSAYKPGDIINSMSKKTIEVLNTDAEGRLTLADALWYAQTVVEANQIVDIATLTGACVVALGEITTGAVTNNDKLMKALLEASKQAGEPLWQLPASDDYREMVKSDYADLLNTSKGSGAGTITAGLFLENFVGETPWVHLDIAGTAYSGSARSYLPQGATGVPVKTLYNFIKNQSEVNLEWRNSMFFGWSHHNLVARYLYRVF